MNKKKRQQKRKQYGKRWGKKKATDPTAHFSNINRCSVCLNKPTGRTRRYQKYNTTGDSKYLYYSWTKLRVNS